MLQVYLYVFQFMLPAIVHVNHQPYLERGDGPIVSITTAFCDVEIFVG
jgi:hypothetical protein